jgi:hypothetical protein
MVFFTKTLDCLESERGILSVQLIYDVVTWFKRAIHEDGYSCISARLYEEFSVHLNTNTLISYFQSSYSYFFTLLQPKYLLILRIVFVCLFLICHLDS